MEFQKMKGINIFFYFQVRLKWFIKTNKIDVMYKKLL